MGQLLQPTDWSARCALIELDAIGCYDAAWCTNALLVTFFRSLVPRPIMRQDPFQGIVRNRDQAVGPAQEALNE